ncbi:hypothetical protein CRM22_007343 [Opisthorchis felineus]|uniref:Major facilitator superfamily (MFS) profile domain-containing protein n=1 Tax=Opisthorchis felineus TaxID=147828 RepID=A0A4S2LPM3_OPIFE|nr:hypothetical protein CRM22_007343 [Opisthorchis felineus]
MGWTPVAHSLTCTVCLLLAIIFFAHVSISGFCFLTNQYVYYRFSEDAGLPYIPNDASSGCKNQSATNRKVDDLQSLRERVQAKTAKFLAVNSLIAMGLSLLALILVAHLSDRYGRRATIGFILLGQSVTNGVTALVVLLHLPVPIIIFGSVACGVLGGGIIALITQTTVCFADLTRIPREAEDVCKQSAAGQPNRGQLERNRLIFLGVLDAALLLAGALGFGLMGSVIQRCGFSSSVIGLLSLYGIPVVLLPFLPETKPPALSPFTVQSTGLSSCNSPDSSSVMQSVTPTSSDLPSFLQLFRSKHPSTLLVAIVLFLHMLVVLSDNQFSFLYLMGAPFCWTPEEVGVYNFVGSFLLSLASLVLTLFTAWSMRVKSPTVLTKNRLSESRHLSNSSVALLVDDEMVEQSQRSAEDFEPTHLQSLYHVIWSRTRMLTYVAVAFFLISLSKLIIGFAFKLSQPFCNAAVYVALVFLFFRAAVVPTLKSFISSLHSAENQNRLFVIIGIAEYFGLLVGEPSLPAFYAFTVSVFPGAAYIFCAVLSAIALAVVLTLLTSVVKELVSLKNTAGSSATVSH